MFRREFRPLLVVLLMFVLISPLAAVAGPPAPGGVYVVQSGDTLAGLAARFGVSQAVLARSNGIADGNRILVGQKLIVPAGNAAVGSTGAASKASGASATAGKGAAGAGSNASSSSTSSGGPPANTTADAGIGPGSVYVMRRGDTLGAIARRFGVSLEAMLAANGLSNGNFVYVGQRLTIPGRSTQANSGTAPSPTAEPGPPPDSATSPNAGVGANTNPGVDAGAASSGSESTTAPSPVPEVGATQARLLMPARVLHPHRLPRQILAPLLMPARILLPRRSPRQILAPPPMPGRFRCQAWMGRISRPMLVQSPLLTLSRQIAGAKAERWINVNLSTQTLTAYEGSKAVFRKRVSSGLRRTPTVVGQFKIYVKVPSQTMTGPGYRLPGVPYVMFFYQGYGIHGTYWHNNFGHPMSHGCINVSTPDAAWLYGWASVGTRVVTHS